MDTHLVYFSPLDSSLRFWKNGGMEESRLAGEARISFSAEKYCIGYNDGKSPHPCPVRAPGSRQCSACGARDISRLYTRLDYSGFESFYEKFRNQEFSVYLASFAHLVKCGVTRSSRLLERAREQGADYFSEIAKTRDAETAYSIEETVQGNFAIRNGLTSAQKMKLAAVQSTPSRITELVSKVRESGILENCEGEMKVNQLGYNIPSRFSEAQQIDGKISGNKGQILFFEKEGENCAVNMSKKTGALFSHSLTGS